MKEEEEGGTYSKKICNLQDTKEGCESRFMEKIFLTNFQFDNITRTNYFLKFEFKILKWSHFIL